MHRFNSLANEYCGADDLTTGIFVASIVGIPGAHSQGKSIKEVIANLTEVIEILKTEDAFNFNAMSTGSHAQK